MKKFEEEIKGKVETMATQPGCSMTRKVWYKADDIHEFSNDWISPEDHQQVAKALVNTTDKLDCAEERVGLLEKTVDQLKSQLEKQQPEIPEVPQFVADWLDRKPLYAINGSIPVEIIGWSQKQTGYADLGMNINHLLKLKVNGYTVEVPKTIVTPCPVCGFEDVESNFCGICGHKNEYVDVAKEKRFYLKDSRELESVGNTCIGFVTLYLKNDGYLTTDKTRAGKFTQQEIGSMETGSYEQIKVEEKQ